MKRSSRSWRAFCYTGAKNIGIVLFTKFNFLPNLRKKGAFENSTKIKLIAS